MNIHNINLPHQKNFEGEEEKNDRLDGDDDSVYRNFQNHEFKLKDSNLDNDVDKHSPYFSKDETLIMTSTDVEIDYHSQFNAGKGSFTNQLMSELTSKQIGMKQ